MESEHIESAAESWSVFGILLSLGSPASVADLSSRCGLTPQHIHSLCQIPHSPLQLTPSSFLTISSFGYFAITRFLNADSNIGFPVITPHEDECHQIVKRRKLDFEEEERNQEVRVLKNVAEHSSSTQTFPVPDNISNCFNITSNYLLDSGFSYKPLEERNLRASWLINSSTQNWKTTRHGIEDSYMSVNGKHICRLDDPDSETNSYLLKVAEPNRLLDLACLPGVIAHKTSVLGTKAEEILSSKNILRATRQMVMCITQATSDISRYGAVFKENIVDERKENPIVDDDNKAEGNIDDGAVEETTSDCLPKGNNEGKITTRIRHGIEDAYMSVNGKHICRLDDPDSETNSYLLKVTKPNRLLNLACLPGVITHKTSVVGTEAEEILSNKSILRATRQMIMCNTHSTSDISRYEAVFKENIVDERKENPIVDDNKAEGNIDDVAVEETTSDCLPKGNNEGKIAMRIRNGMPSLGIAKPKMSVQNVTNYSGNMLPGDQKHLEKLQSKPIVGPSEKREKKSNSMKQNSCDKNNYHKERKEKHKDNKNKPVHVSKNKQLLESECPKFESYIVEEEEGSGGYGTVYRARRKTDGLAFAIKCPHLKANKNHIQNEVKMLERFGGNNFIIKYVGSLKSGDDSDCLVLQHVEHDRPEVLKREIDISHLQWYGFCMFKSLAALHKQGIVHRDVKPGNFLFSRKANKGYLIDFNLALDLRQKYGFPEKKKASSKLSFDHVPSATKSLSPASYKKSASPGALGQSNHEAGKLQMHIPRNLKRKVGPPKDNAYAANGNIIKSQGADGSIITSTKNAMSIRSAERCREPMPCQGRKELLNLVQEALQGSNSEAVNGPTSKRKRVAATSGNIERKFVRVTPMPLHSAGVPVAGAGLLKDISDIRQKREGSCVGTKGFRAPEVLFRSAHQGQKVDVWSAGVTLLYLMIGRAPFSGDLDQNIKEIVKLRGTEDVWEVAKLHNRESSFPSDLFDIKLSQPIELLDWCKSNTRRPLDIFPSSLFDLVDKCLTVNPRLRISAEEALGHPFFAPCHDVVRNYRLHKQGINTEPDTNCSSVP